jgi:hypothetical protein
MLSPGFWALYVVSAMLFLIVVTSSWRLAGFASNRRSSSTVNLEAIVGLRCDDCRFCGHHAQHALERLLAPFWRQPSRNGSGTGALAAPWTVSRLVFCGGYRFGLVRKGRGPSLNSRLVDIGVCRLSTHLHVSDGLGPALVADIAVLGRLP